MQPTKNNDHRIQNNRLAEFPGPLADLLEALHLARLDAPVRHRLETTRFDEVRLGDLDLDDLVVFFLALGGAPLVTKVGEEVREEKMEGEDYGD